MIVVNEAQRAEFLNAGINVSVNARLDTPFFWEKEGVIVGESTVGQNVRLGMYSYVGQDCIIEPDVSIGRYTALRPRVLVGMQNHNLHAGAMNLSLKPPHPTVPGHDVWIGAAAVIMNGVTIGNGAVVGAGAVVTRSIEPYEIVVGVPARRLRRRFSDELITELAATQWWLYSPDRLAGLGGGPHKMLFDNPVLKDPVKLIDAMRNIDMGPILPEAYFGIN